MRARGRLTIVESQDVAVDVGFPSFPVEELLHPCGGRKSFIPQTERAIPGAGEGSAVDEGIALDGKRFRPPQVALAVTVPFIFAEDPFAAVEAQLRKAVDGHEFLFVAAIDVSPSLGRWFAVGQIISRLVYVKRERRRRTDRAPTYNLLSGSCIFPAPDPGGMGLRNLVDRERSCPGGRIDLPRYGSERRERGSMPIGRVRA